MTQLGLFSCRPLRRKPAPIIGAHEWKIEMRVRGHHLVSIGSLNETVTHPREVFRAAVIAAAYAVIVMYNHPNGDPAPSQTDRQITKVFAEAGHLLRIQVTDHILVGHVKDSSFKEAGVL